ncbi:DUF6221 family protein [Streptomyces rubiginosohelvolus]|uniref:DUF6221 family protein n=1 Tax=Streptomyces rubiginosohelvolus TaxID=67362 RepID=UPI0033DEF030
MDDLVQFLRDRLEDDEQEAAGASPGPWHADAEADEVLAVDDIVVAEGFALSGRQLRATTHHIARHDPARILREVEAKRELIRLAEAAHDYHETFMSGFAAEMEKALRLFAVAYADHPDYRDEWRP